MSDGDQKRTADRGSGRGAGRGGGKGTSPQSTGRRNLPDTPRFRKLTGDAPGNELRPYLIKRPRRGIKTDRVDPRDLAKFEVRFFCDDCCHYSHANKLCTIGYIAQHTREEQMARYNLTGFMAFCRFAEID